MNQTNKKQQQEEKKQSNNNNHRKNKKVTFLHPIINILQRNLKNDFRYNVYFNDE